MHGYDAPIGTPPYRLSTSFSMPCACSGGPGPLLDATIYRSGMFDDPGFFENGVSALVIGIPVLAGLLTIVAGVVRWQRSRRLAEVGQRVTAVVADNQQLSQSGGGVRFLPVVRFRTLDGREVKTVLDDAPSHRSHLTDTPIEVIYDPDDPQRIAGAGNRGGGGIAAIVVGVVLLAFAVLAYLVLSSAFS
jgi:hypothetical protein